MTLGSTGCWTPWVGTSRHQGHNELFGDILLGGRTTLRALLFRFTAFVHRALVEPHRIVKRREIPDVLAVLRRGASLEKEADAVHGEPQLRRRG